MTCIAALIDSDGAIWMGADSAVTYGTEQRTSAQPKIVQRGPLLIGATGTVRHVNLLHTFTPPDPDALEDPTEYITGPVIDALRTHFKDAGTAKTTNGAERAGGAMFLIGCRSRLFVVDDAYGVCQVADFDAVGSGSEVAWGALFASEGERYFGDDNPRGRLYEALHAAAARDCYVAPPYTILSTADAS